MLINQIHIKNVGVARELDIKPGAVTIFKGRNGSGKSAAIKAIRSCLNKGNYAHLLAEGAKEGETVLVFEDGLTVRRAIGPEKSTLQVKNGAMKGSWDTIESEIDAMAVNAEAFMYVNDEKKFLQLLLESMPLTIDEEKLKEVLPGWLIPKGHPLEVLDQLYKNIYDERTGVNKVLKDKEASARELRAKISAGAIDETLSQQLAVFEEQLKAHQVRVLEMERQLDREEEEATQEARAERDASIQSARDRIHAKIKELEKELVAIEEDERITFETCTTAVRSEFRSRRSAFAANSTAITQDLDRQVTSLREQIRSQDQLKSVLELAERDEKNAELARESSQHLTSQLDALQQFKADLLKELPIRGASVENGIVLIDGKRINEIPDSRRAEFGVDVAIARADQAGWPIVVVDGMEKLDDDRFEHWKEYLQRCGRQVFCARWSTGDFEVETLPALEAMD